MADRLTIERLRKRRDFLLAAKGRRAGRGPFVVECRARGDEAAPRVGFTVTKRTAKKAVERNRIRRRLREAVRAAAETAISPGCDYVVIGRRSALSRGFSDLTSELAGALTEVSRPAASSGGRRERAQARSSRR